MEKMYEVGKIDIDWGTQHGKIDWGTQHPNNNVARPAVDENEKKEKKEKKDEIWIKMDVEI